MCPFYDFRFHAWARPAERYVGVARPRHRDHPCDPALDLLGAGTAASVVAVVEPTPAELTPLELDEKVAHLAAGVAAQILERGAVAVDDDSGVERGAGGGPARRHGSGPPVAPGVLGDAQAVTAIIWSPQALRDLEAIQAFIAEDSPIYADLVVRRL